MLLENCDSGGFEFVHQEEAAGYLAFGLFSLPDFFAVGDWRVADVFVKQAAERSETLKSHFKTNVRHPQLISPEQLFRLLNPAFDQILVRSFVERLSKQPQEVVTQKQAFSEIWSRLSG